MVKSRVLQEAINTTPRTAREYRKKYMLVKKLCPELDFKVLTEGN